MNAPTSTKRPRGRAANNPYRLVRRAHHVATEIWERGDEVTADLIRAVADELQKEISDRITDYRASVRRSAERNAEFRKLRTLLREGDTDKALAMLELRITFPELP